MCVLQVVLDSNDACVYNTFPAFTFEENTEFQNSPIGTPWYNVSCTEEDVRDSSAWRGCGLLVMRFEACGDMNGCSWL
jgi:hypothetical protein